MYYNTQTNESNSLPYIIPNSRIVNPSSNHKNTQYRQPARTTSLQRQEHYFERESVVDPTFRPAYHGQPIRETFIEPNISKLTINTNHELIKDVHYHTQQMQSNVHYVVNSPVQHGYVDLPRPSAAVIEQNPMMKPSRSTRAPPLPPLVIPPTPTRSTPTRANFITTPGGLSTPGSSQSNNSPIHGYSPSTPNNGYSPTAYMNNGLSPTHHGLSPMTHSPVHGYSPSTPSPLTPSDNDKKKALHKKLSFMPVNETERLIHQGIKHHEAGRLEQATQLFKKASNMDSPIAMFLYGISLRHGWGCTKNEYLAFQYLQKAAEHAVEELTSRVNMSAAKNELIMSIYELGVSFRHGWGCKKNKETAVYYFKIAAELNDADAQNDLGHCYYHGHGVKKDMYLAAQYYRMAEKQGHGIMGNSWIWKSKYDKRK